MPNRNYRNGVAKEYRIVKRLRSEGFEIAQRQAGSHSPFDVIGIDKKNKKIKFIQSKPKSMSENAKNKILQENSWLSDEFICEFIVE